MRVVSMARKSKVDKCVCVHVHTHKRGCAHLHASPFLGVPEANPMLGQYKLVKKTTFESIAVVYPHYIMRFCFISSEQDTRLRFVQSNLHFNHS
jgi:hypothetical protein